MTLNEAQAYSIFDSGTSSIFISNNYFRTFLQKIYSQVGDREYYLSNGVVNTACYPNFPILYFMFDNFWLAVEPEDYVIDISPAQDASSCVLLLQPTDSPMLIFGAPIFRGNYVVHNAAMSTIGFAPHKGSTKEAPVAGELPSKRLGGSPTSSSGDSSADTDVDDETDTGSTGDENIYIYNGTVHIKHNKYAPTKGKIWSWIIVVLIICVSIPIFTYALYPAIESSGIWVVILTAIGWFSIWIFPMIFIAQPFIRKAIDKDDNIVVDIR